MKVIAITARILLGIVFVFSGFVKGIDPWGSTYKFIEYFTAFGMPALSPAALTLAILQNALEFVIGVALILGLRMKETAWGTLVFMGFYTILTFILALTNPVTDCGCFGDALKLTNWQTFYKNLVLLVLALIVFGYRKKYLPAYSLVGEWIWVAGFSVLIISISIHCYQHLPYIDFRPYHVGADIPQGMLMPEGIPADEFKTTLIYEKDGVVKEFPEDNYPWDDTTWVWKETKSVLIKKGYEPPIHNFSITTMEGDDITDDVLAFEGYTFLLVAPRIDKCNKQALDRATEVVEFCNQHGYRFYCLTSSPQSEIEALKAEMGLKYDFCFTDGITLETIVRAHPGLVLIQKGTILDKWHYNDMPNATSLSPNLLSFSIKDQAAKSNNRLINGLILTFVFFAFVFRSFSHVSSPNGRDEE